MCRRYKKLLSLYLVISVILTQMFFINTAFGAEAKKYRLYGSGRIQTAIEISKNGWNSKSDYAVMATAYDFPDALCAAPLAAKLNAPILLTEKSGLSIDIINELSRLNVKKVFIIGGVGVVSDTVVNSLKSKGIECQRLFGSDRYQTSLAVAKYMASNFGLNREIAVATGEDFPDALSISPIAAKLGMPVILVPRYNLQEGLESFASINGINKTYIVGGTDIISESAAAKLPGVERIYGSDKYERNAKVLNKFVKYIDFSRVYVATGEDFPDALAGSALAPITSSPIILAGGQILESTKNLVKESVKESSMVIALGGPAVVADSVVYGIVNSINGINIGDALKVESVSAINLNQIKLVYTKKVDKASAETPSNYRLGDITLTSSDSIILQADGRTVDIILDNAVSQQDSKIFTVKDNAVFSEDNSSKVPKYEKELSFLDTAAPAVKAVTASGNSGLIIEFTEAIKVPGELLGKVGSSFKLDGQYLTYWGLSNAAAVDATASNSYSNKIELRFGTGIPAGSHVLNITDSAPQYFVDKAGFRVGSTSISFTVDALTNAPRITSVAGEDNGMVYVTYDRAMDPVTAENALRYSVNNAAPLAASFKTGSGSKIVKLVFAPNVVGIGGNVLEVDYSVKDTYGNSLSPNTDVRLAFNAANDNTKPEVLSAGVTDNTHIRVKFSEAVDNQYAASKGNYTLEDSNGSILNYISTIYSDSASAYSDTFILSLGTALTGDSYKLKIKNIADLARFPNVMYDYATSLTWRDSEAPAIAEEIVPAGSSSQVIVYFSETMDRTSITNRSNFLYKDGSDVIHELPGSASIAASDDNKSVTITFPSTYSVKAYGWSGLYDVKGIVVSGVKDTAGNILSGVTGYRDVISSSTAQNRPTYVENTFKLYSDSDKVWGEFEFSEAIATISITDFRVTGVIPDAAYLSGKKLNLTFVNTDKMSIIKGAGSSAQLSTAATSSVNAAGAHINSISNKTVYDERIAPEIVSVSAFNGSGEDSVKVRFSETVDGTITDYYKDDFNFLGGGNTIEPQYVTVSGEYVIYHFSANSFTVGSRVTVRALTSNISIRDARDWSGDQNVYVPKSSDISGISATAQ